MAAEIGLRAGFRIKPQLAFPLALIRPVACVAFIGEYGPHVAVELDRGILRSGVSVREMDLRPPDDKPPDDTGPPPTRH